MSGWRSWISLLLLGALWAVLSTTAMNHRLFPTLVDVGNALKEMINSGELVRDIAASARRAFVGFIVGAMSGIALGYATGRNRVLDHALGGIFQILRPLPPISLVPLFILWFGINELSKYIIVAFGVFFPVWISTHLGTQAVDRRLLWMAQSLGASRGVIALEVILPAALPTIVSGLRTSIGVAFFCLVAAELAGALDGIVFRMNLSQSSFRVDRLVAGLIVLGVVSAVCDAIFMKFVRFAFPWIEHAFFRNKDLET